MTKKQLALLLALLSVALYLPTLRFDFVWDAQSVIRQNAFVHDLRHLGDVLTLRVMRMDVMDNNRPAFLLSAMLEWVLWGDRPGAFHFTNVLMHAAVVVLLFAFAQRLTGKWPAFFAVLIFAVHPLNCEPVAEVSYRKDLMVALCIFAALNFAAMFAPKWSARNVWLGFFCVFSLFFAVAAKENGVAGPAVLIGYWLLFRRNESKRGWLLLCVCASAAVGGFLFARFTLPPKHSDVFVDNASPLAGNFVDLLMIQTRMWCAYFRNIVAPINLCADYGSFSIRNFSFAVSFAVVSVIIAVQFVAALANRAAALGALIFWSALLPVSNFVPLYRAMADRFLYLPMTGLALMLAAIPWNQSIKHRAATASAFVVAAIFALVTELRLAVWRDSVSLWTDTLEKNPQSYTAADNLGWAFLDRAQPDEALPPFRKAIEISAGKKADPLAGLALACEALGQTADANAATQRATSVDPHYAEPARLVEALIFDSATAQKFDALVQRNKTR